MGRSYPLTCGGNIPSMALDRVLLSSNTRSSAQDQSGIHDQHRSRATTTHQSYAMPAFNADHTVVWYHNATIAHFVHGFRFSSWLRSHCLETIVGKVSLHHVPNHDTSRPNIHTVNSGIPRIPTRLRVRCCHSRHASSLDRPDTVTH